MTRITPDEQLAEDLAGFYADPLGYVMYMFPWDTDSTIQQVALPVEYQDRFECEWGPDVWQCEFLEQLGVDIREHNFDGRNAVSPVRYVVSSGHGIGKSALSAWLVKFILDTRPFSVGTVTANTAPQLKSKTWARVGFWHNISLTKHWFQYNSGRGNMTLFHREHKENWKCDAQTCREEDSESFAGQHSVSSTSFYIFDEASAISEKIYEVREGGLTDGEPMTFDFGNPTRNSGRFFESCQGRLKDRHRRWQIDSRDVAITGNKKLFEEWAEDYGEESDFFKVRVRGIFPSMGNLQFIATDAVEEAMRRETPPQDKADQLIIGVDVARFGNNETVIYPRIGYDARSFAPVPGKGRYRGLDMVQVEGRIIEMIHEFRNMGLECAGLFIDEGGIGGGVVDHLRHYGYNPIGVNFGGRPTDSKTYRFKVDEMWGGMKADMHKLVLPRLNAGLDLKMQLTQREFGYTKAGDKINLESKEVMNDRLGGEAASPDIADALSLGWAAEVAPMLRPGGQPYSHSAAVHEFDPLTYEGPRKERVWDMTNKMWINM